MENYRRKLLEFAYRHYRDIPPWMRARVPQGIEDWARGALGSARRQARAGSSGKTGGRGSIGMVRVLDDWLWGGFSQSALDELRAIADAPVRPKTVAQVAEANCRLAIWYAVQGDDAEAMRRIQKMRLVREDTARDPRQYLLEAMLWCRLGEGEEARRGLKRGSEGPDPSIRLMRANSWNPALVRGDVDEGEAAVLRQVNMLMEKAGMDRLRKLDPAAALSIDNLTGCGVADAIEDPEKVTVIVPVHNAQDTILTALRGLAEQRWRNIEVLVVDDVSTDGTAGVVEAFCRTDPRFRLIRRAQNGGSYACRNTAMAEATGEFVTVHDADDWSHPERISCQVLDLRESGLPMNISVWARAEPSLVFVGGWRPSRSLLLPNYSSILYRREVFARAGLWDEVRVAADKEFVKRVMAVYGIAEPKPLLPKVPLAFGRSSAQSLTRTGHTHVMTLHHGIRREYHEANSHWHARLAAGEAALPAPGTRAFPAPRPMLRDRDARDEVDLLFIADWNLVGGTFHSARNMVLAARAAGLSCAILHYRRYPLDVTKPLRSEVRDFALEHDLRILAPGEALRARVVVLTYPPILQHRMDRFPEIEHEAVAVVVNQMAERDVQGLDVAYDPARVRDNLRALLGSEGDWMPISGRVRALMDVDARYPAPGAETWTPLVDTAEWMARRQRWRGAERAEPVLGRHGRDHYLKWPADPQNLRAAYGADRPCRVQFLGGAHEAGKILGSWPSNWSEEKFNSRDVRDFLLELDIFLHFPNETYIEEFGRAPMEAMALGIPVILPPVFRETFGEAATYAEPAEVWAAVERLWHDRAAWEERAEAGRRFVAEACGHDAFAARIEALLARSRSATAAASQGDGADAPVPLGQRRSA